jgi:hypothetical protein
MWCASHALSVAPSPVSDLEGATDVDVVGATADLVGTLPTVGLVLGAAALPRPPLAPQAARGPTTAQPIAIPRATRPAFTVLISACPEACRSVSPPIAVGAEQALVHDHTANHDRDPVTPVLVATTVDLV